MLSEHAGYHCQHRSDDFPIIAEIIQAHQPLVAIELGTDKGGFAGFLADTLRPWHGHVHTFDHVKKYEDHLSQRFGNLTGHLADVLGQPFPFILELFRTYGARVLLYCDNGNKVQELQLYAPHVAVGGLVGVHDYGTEVPAAGAEELMAGLGYAQFGHDRMETLRNEWYPEPMTRFWKRTTIPVAIQPAPVEPVRVPAEPTPPPPAPPPPDRDPTEPAPVLRPRRGWGRKR
jgi:hypothetical protein